MVAGLMSRQVAGKQQVRNVDNVGIKAVANTDGGRLRMRPQGTVRPPHCIHSDLHIPETETCNE